MEFTGYDIVGMIFTMTSIVVSVLEMVVFMIIILNSRYMNVYYKSAIYLIMFIGICIVTMKLNPLYRVFVVPIIIMLYIILNYKEKLWRKLVVFGLFEIYIHIYEISIMGILSCMGVDLMKLMQEHQYYVLIFLILRPTVTLVLALGIKKLLFQDKRDYVLLKEKNNACYIIISGLGILFPNIYLVYTKINRLQIRQQTIYLACVCIIIVVIVIVIIYLVAMIKKIEANEINKKLLKQKQRFLQARSMEADECKNEINKMKADMNDLLKLVYEGHKLERVMILDQLDKTIKYYKDQSNKNKDVNLIVGYYENRLMVEGKRENIEIKIENYTVCNMGVMDIDLSIILSNVITNAIKSCLGKLKNRFIYLRVIYQDEKVYISCKNSKGEDYKQNEIKDYMKHGYGMQNIKDIINMYDGEMKIIQDEEWFEIKMMVPSCKSYIY